MQKMAAASLADLVRIAERLEIPITAFAPDRRNSERDARKNLSWRSSMTIRGCSNCSRNCWSRRVTRFVASRRRQRCSQRGSPELDLPHHRHRHAGDGWLRTARPRNEGASGSAGVPDHRPPRDRRADQRTGRREFLPQAVRWPGLAGGDRDGINSTGTWKVNMIIDSSLSRKSALVLQARCSRRTAAARHHCRRRRVVREALSELMQSAGFAAVASPRRSELLDDRVLDRPGLPHPRRAHARRERSRSPASPDGAETPSRSSS